MTRLELEQLIAGLVDPLSPAECASLAARTAPIRLWARAQGVEMLLPDQRQLRAGASQPSPAVCVQEPLGPPPADVSRTHSATAARSTSRPRYVMSFGLAPVAESSAHTPEPQG